MVWYIWKGFTNKWLFWHVFIDHVLWSDFLVIQEIKGVPKKKRYIRNLKVRRKSEGEKREGREDAGREGRNGRREEGGEGGKGGGREGQMKGGREVGKKEYLVWGGGLQYKKD